MSWAELAELKSSAQLSSTKFFKFTTLEARLELQLSSSSAQLFRKSSKNSSVFSYSTAAQLRYFFKIIWNSGFNFLWKWYIPKRRNKSRVFERGELTASEGVVLSHGWKTATILQNPSKSQWPWSSMKRPIILGASGLRWKEWISWKSSESRTPLLFLSSSSNRFHRRFIVLSGNL